MCRNCNAVITDGATRRRKYAYGHTKVDSRGRTITYLYPGHPYANSGGWQYRYRLIVMFALRRKLHRDEHVDHVDGNVHNDDLRNLRVVIARDHAIRHNGSGSYDVIAEYVEGKGFVEKGYDDDAHNVPF